MTDDVGTFEKLESDPTGTWATISGIRYKVLEYVEPFAARRKPGDEVGIVYSYDKDGSTRALTKIVGVKKEPVASKTGTNRILEGIIVARKGNNLTVLANGKESVFVLGPYMARLRDTLFVGQEIKMDVNKDSFIETLSFLGEVLSEDKVLKPPVHTAAEIKRESALKNPTGQAPIVPPAAEKQGQIQSTSPSPPASPRPRVVPPPASRVSIDCSINLGGYESLKVGVQGEASDLPAQKEFLIDTLRGMGQRNVMAQSAIESYVFRVLEAAPMGVA